MSTTDEGGETAFDADSDSGEHLKAAIERAWRET
jgi:hypothetical protein